MKSRKSLLLFILSFSFPLLLFCQRPVSSLKDSTTSFQIITLKDGTVLKGKIVKKENRTIYFQDDELDTVLFDVKHIYHIEDVSSNGYYLIELTNGTTVNGKIISKNNKDLVLENTTLGRVSFSENKIKTIKSVAQDEMHHGEYWFHDALSTQYLFLPSAIPMKKNDTYYRNTDGLLNTFRTQLSNDFSLYGGAFFPFAGIISPNFNYKVAPHVYLGGGGLLSGILGGHYLGGGYGTFTFGTSNSNISVAGLYCSILNNGGWRFSRRFTLKDFGAISISGMHRISSRLAVVTENWITLPDAGFEFFSGGVRLLREKSSWEFGWSSVYAFGKYFVRNPKYKNQRILLMQMPIISYVRNL